MQDSIPCIEKGSFGVVVAAVQIESHCSLFCSCCTLGVLLPRVDTCEHTEQSKCGNSIYFLFFINRYFITYNRVVTNGRKRGYKRRKTIYCRLPWYFFCRAIYICTASSEYICIEHVTSTLYQTAPLPQCRTYGRTPHIRGRNCLLSDVESQRSLAHAQASPILAMKYDVDQLTETGPNYLQF